MKENIIAGSTVTVLYMYTCTDAVRVHVHVELHLSNVQVKKAVGPTTTLELEFLLN